MAHFSKYFRPGAVVINAASTEPALEATACKNPDGKFAVVVLNRTEKPIDFKIKNGAQAIKPSIPAHAIMTFVF